MLSFPILIRSAGLVVAVNLLLRLVLLFNSWLIKWDLPDAEGPARIMSCLFEGVTLFAVINAWVCILAGLSDDGWLTQLLIVKVFYFGRQFFDLTRFVFLGLFGVGDN